MESFSTSDRGALLRARVAPLARCARLFLPGRFLPAVEAVRSTLSGEPMYRFSRQIYVQIRDAIDPHPDTISVAEARRRVLRACESTVERLARDARYFPKPARSLFQEIRYYF